RAFETEGVCSPYQRFDWVHAFTTELAPRDGLRARILLLRDEAGRPALLLPLVLRRSRGVTIATFAGGKQANFNLPIVAKGFASRVPARDIKGLLLDAGRALGADVFVFVNQPRAWRGESNPLASLDNVASPSQGFKLSLGPNADQTVARAFSSETRKKMRKKVRLLSELGEPRFLQGRTAADVETILAAFFEQKQARFRDAGIQNPFEGEAQNFIRRACLAGLDRGEPAIELHAMAIGERIVATFGGAADRWRLCGMFNSFDTGPDVSRHSPGELLLAQIIRVQCERGHDVFDLGVGEARYKTSLCDEVEELVDTFVPVTVRGKAYAAATTQLVACKRFVKQTAWTWRAVNLLRGLKATLRRS
ncbi:MAG TPA: GNAT family N-acetyltransferase, partial [Beijerinckiaceae bacterium]|nr:GNAT family N-acetyltransferase [Beijerinckiaceae bacterium]